MSHDGFFFPPPTAAIATNPIVFFIVGILVGIVVHEAGHALVAALLRVPVRLIGIGVGPTLARFRVGPAWVVLRLLPTLGYVVTLPHLTPRRAADAAVLLAGVTGNAVLFATLGAVAATWPVLDAPCRQMAGAQVVVIISNLLPLGRDTDGGRLLRLTLRKPAGLRPAFDHFRAQVVAPAALAAPAVLSRHCPELLFCMLCTTSDEAWADAWGVRETQRTLQKLFATPGLPPIERALAGITLIHRQLAYFPGEASSASLDAWYEAALAVHPSPGLAEAIRATIMAWQGHAAAARPLLDQAVAAPRFAGQLAVIHAARAWTAAASGQRDEMLAALALAAAASRDNEVLRRLSQDGVKRHADRLLADRLARPDQQETPDGQVKLKWPCSRSRERV